MRGGGIALTIGLLAIISVNKAMAQYSCQTATFIEVKDNCELETYYQSGYDDRWFSFSSETQGIGFGIMWDYTPKWAYIPYDTLYIYTGTCDSLIEYAMLSPIPSGGEVFLNDTGDVFFRFTRQISTPQNIEFDLCVFGILTPVCDPKIGLDTSEICLGECITITNNSNFYDHPVSSFSLTIDPPAEIWNAGGTSYFGVYGVLSGDDSPPAFISNGDKLKICPITAGSYSINAHWFFSEYPNCFVTKNFLVYDTQIADIDIFGTPCGLIQNNTLSIPAFDVPCCVENIEFSYTHPDPNNLPNIHWFFHDESDISQSYGLYTPYLYNYIQGSIIETNITTIITELQINCNDTFYLSMIISGKCIDDTITKAFVLIPPDLDFTSTTACLGTPTNFHSTVDPDCVETWHWNFGDGTIITGQSPDEFHTYANSGVFQVTLTAYYYALCSVVVTHPVTVFDFEFDIVATPNPVCVGDDILFYIDNYTCPVPMLGFLWDFGDGYFSSDFLPTHYYSQSGIYQVSLIVTTQYGNYNASNQITIHVIPLPETPVISGANYACSDNSSYVIDNYNSQYDYTWNVIVDGIIVETQTGGSSFIYDWTIQYYSKGGLIQVIVTDPITGCSSEADFLVNGCCDPAGADYVWTNAYIDSGGNYFGKTCIINGAVTLEHDYSFQGCTFYFAPESSLILQNGEMTFNISLFTNCLDTAWKEINLRGTEGRVTFTEDTVQFSINGIVNSNCRELLIRGCTFNNNFEQGVYVSNCQSFSNPDFVNFSSNKFQTIGTGCLYPNTNLRAKTGVKLQNNFVVSKLRIHGNQFNRLGNGIYSTNSCVRLTGNSFSSIGGILPFQFSDCAVKSVNTLNMIGIIFPFDVEDYNIFNNCAIGGVNIGGYHNLSIKNNTFSNSTSGYGIRYQNVKKGSVNITDNTLTNIGIGIHAIGNGAWNGIHQSNILRNNISFTLISKSVTGIVIDEEDPSTQSAAYLIKNNTIILNSNLAKGVRLVNSKNVIVRENDITIRNSSSTFMRNVGIESINSSFAVIYLNNIFGVNYSSSSTSFGVKLQNSASNIVQCNHVRYFGYGISAHNVCSSAQIWDNKLEDQQFGLTLFDSGFIGTQGSPTRHSNNEWKNVTHPTYTFYSEGVNSLLYVKNSNPINGWYKNPIILHNEYAPLISPYSIFSKDATTAGGMIRACPSSANIVISNVGEMEKLINGEMFFSEYPEVSTELGKWQAFENAQEDSTLLSNSSIRSYIDNMSSTSHGKTIEAREKIAEGDLQIAMQLNNKISAENNFDAASKLFNQVLIDYYLNEMKLTDIQKAELLNLAYQCPYVHGEAVYGARAMMSQYDTDLIYFLHICEIDFSQRALMDSSEQKQPKESIIVYPNPATNILFFEFVNFERIEGNVVIEIFSMEGSRIFSKSFPSEKQLKIDISSFSDGVYSYNIQTQIENFSGRIIILK